MRWTRPPFCPPWSALGRPRGPVERARAAYARIVWRRSSPPRRALLVLWLAGWPLVALGAALAATARHGPALRRARGRSLLRQLAQELHLALRFGVPPRSYYLFRLDRDENRARAHEYLHRYETKESGGIYFVLRRRGSGHGPILYDKWRFFERCRRSGLPSPEVLLRVSRGALHWSGAGPDSLPRRDLFVKPRRGQGGRGAERWDWREGDRYAQPGGRELSSEALLARLRQRSRDQALLVQPRIRNHSELRDLGNGALTTVRIVTCQDEEGRPEPVVAVFRMAVGANPVVDNIHAGGIASPVDLATGKLGRAVALAPASGFLDAHPDTGAPIAGRSLPGWSEALELARRAHALFDGLVVAGWDVAVSEAGPVLVEGNGAPCVNLIQRPWDRPLGATRMGELLAHHLERAEGRG